MIAAFDAQYGAEKQKDVNTYHQAKPGIMVGNM